MHESRDFSARAGKSRQVHKVFKCELYTNINPIKISCYSSQTLQMIKYELLFKISFTFINYLFKIFQILSRVLKNIKRQSTFLLV